MRKKKQEKGNTQRTNLKYYRIFPDLLVSNTQYTEDCGFQIALHTKGTSRYNLTKKRSRLRRDGERASFLLPVSVLLYHNGYVNSVKLFFNE